MPVDAMLEKLYPSYRLSLFRWWPSPRGSASYESVKVVAREGREGELGLLVDSVGLFRSLLVPLTVPLDPTNKLAR